MTDKDDPYQPQNVPLFEALYGKHLISLGGLPAIENMFFDIQIHQINALDIGFGIGGVAYYLANTYELNISGVEVYPWMADYATQHAPDELKNQLQFACYLENGDIPFEKNAFDLAYSKGVLNHVKDKLPLFKQIHGHLKENALFVIADWIYPTIPPAQTGPLMFETQASYQSTLEEAGFKNICFRDDSELFIDYVSAFLENLDKQQAYIEQNFGEDIFLMIKNDHIQLRDKIRNKSKIATRILAET